MTAMREQFLKCQVYKGMFSDELAIKVSSKRGDASFFVPKNLVQESEGRVKVRVYREGQTSWAVLPDENQTAVPVEEGDLLAV
jgi:hypothetical protein